MSELAGEYAGFAFDVDKTAVPVGAMTVESEELVEAFHALPPDVIAIAATGRPLEGFLPIARALGLKHDSVVANGALIIDPQTGESWRENLLSEDQVEGIISACEEHPSHLWLGGDPKNGTGLKRREQDDAIEQSASAYLVDIPEEVAREIQARISEIPDMYVYLAQSWSGTEGMSNICMSHTQARKHIALREIFGKYAVDSSKMVGIGDGVNDIALFEAVGHRIAVGDAEPELIEQADEVVAPHDEGGLLQVVERFIR